MRVRPAPYERPLRRRARGARRRSGL